MNKYRIIVTALKILSTRNEQFPVVGTVLAYQGIWSSSPVRSNSSLWRNSHVWRTPDGNQTAHICQTILTPLNSTGFHPVKSIPWWYSHASSSFHHECHRGLLSSLGSAFCSCVGSIFINIFSFQQDHSFSNNENKSYKINKQDSVDKTFSIVPRFWCYAEDERRYLRHFTNLQLLEQFAGSKDQWIDDTGNCKGSTHHGTDRCYERVELLTVFRVFHGNRLDEEKYLNPLSFSRFLP